MPHHLQCMNMVYLSRTAYVHFAAYWQSCSTSLVNYETTFYFIVKLVNGVSGSHYFSSKETDLQVICVLDSF
jgi:hypothetical protein